MLSTSKLFRNPSAGGATDPFFPYVPLLLETTTTNGQQNNTFLDSSTNNFTITRNGTPTQGSVTPYWPNGYWSTNLNGSTDTLTTVSGAMSYAGDFSIECWFNTTTTTTYACLYSDETGSTGGTILLNNGANNGQIVVFIGGAVSAFTSSSTGLNNGTWNHVALTRSGSTVRLFINGALQNTTTASGTITTTSTVRIGSSFFASRFFGGYISNFRIVVGSPVYTAAFTPSTTPLTAITNTSLLTCQSNRFIDNSTNNRTITVVSTPKVQAFQPFSPAASYTPAAYGGSGYFPSTGTDYLQVPAGTAFAPGTGDFTLEAWVYATSGTDNYVWTQAVSGTNYFLLGFGTTAYFYSTLSGGGTAINGPASSIVANSWNHIAVSRSSGTVRVFVNGVSGTATSNTTNLSNVSYVPTIGRYSFSALGVWTGYISNLRYVNGTAVYTGNFTPPALAPLTTAGSTSAASYSSTTNVNTSFASSATSLLTNFTNAGIYDAAVQNNAITVGDAQASTTQSKWSPTSMKFDGTGDYLSIPDSPAFAFGTSNFTVECWIYPTSVANEAMIAGQWSGSTGSTTLNWALMFSAGSTGYLRFITSSNGSSVLFDLSTSTTSFTISLNVWQYIAVVRNGSTFTLYVDGVSRATTTNASGLFDATNVFTVGAESDTPSQFFNGYIQDLRITKGVARTIATPTSAFPTR